MGEFFQHPAVVAASMIRGNGCGSMGKEEKMHLSCMVPHRF